MRDILSDVIRWQRDGASIALATVVQTWGSSPRRAGAKMALASDGRIAGSVSGGCVEAAVFEAGIQVLKTNRPKLLHFGVADETAWQVGLACGGSIDIFVKPLDTVFFDSLRTAWTDESTSAHAAVIRGSAEILGNEILIHENGDVSGRIGSGWDAEITALARDALAAGESRRFILDEETEVFVEIISPPPTLVVVGGVHIAIALV